MLSVICHLLQSLFNLTAADPRYTINTVLPTLLDMLNSIDLNVRHGAVLATAEILEASYNRFNDKIESIIGKNVQKCDILLGTFFLSGNVPRFSGFFQERRLCPTYKI